MANKLYDEASVQAIANAIRSKNKTETKYKISQMAQAIEDIPAVIKRVTGNPIEFTDGADAPLVKCVTQITGSQDLHGYDKPWVGGAGKNKYNGNSDVSLTGAGRLIPNNYSNPLSAGTYTIVFNLLEIPSTSQINFVAWDSGNNVVCNETKTLSQGNNYITVTASSDIETITLVSSNSNSGTYSNIMIIKGSTPDYVYEPYSNICPITAYTEGEIEVRGHNVSDEVYESGYIDLDTGANAPSNITKRTVNYIKIQPNTQYCYVSGTSNSVRIAFYGEDKSYVGKIGNNDANPQIFTTPNNAYYLRYYIGNDTHAGVNYPKTVNTYEPYTSTTHTTTYPSAIYRGSEDCVEGEVTSEAEVKNISDFTWNYSTGVATNRHYYTSLPNDNILLSCYPLVDWSTFQDSDCCACYYGGYLRIKDTQYDDTTIFTAISNFVTARGSEQIAYELATPTTSSVTPTNLPIKSLSGYNHIESSTGEMTIDYITDAYQNFVDTVESALPNTRKGGTSKAMDVFLSLDTLEETISSENIETKEDNNSENNNSEDISENIEETR